jgi:Holliday junction resolvase
MKIAKFLKPYFKVSMTRVDNKRIKRFQVNCAKSKTYKIESEELDEFEDLNPIITKTATKIFTQKTTKKSKKNRS